MHIKLLTSVISGLTVCSASAASLSITGNLFGPLQDSAGTNLADGSLVQVGYLLGVSAATDPSSYTTADWNTFTPIAGAGLTFADNKSITTSTVFGFDSSFLLQSVVTDPDSSEFDGAFTPVRIAFRIFDSVTDFNGADFNTVTSSNTDAILEPSIDPPVPKIGTAEIALNDMSSLGFFWEDNANPFQTSIAATAVPEPSSSVTALLGFALLLGARRRK